MIDIDRWMAVLRQHFPSGLVFKDLTLSRADWSFLAASPEPLLLRLNIADISDAVEQLVSAGLSPISACALLIGEPEYRHIVSADAGSIALKSRALTETSILLLIAEDITPLLQKRLQGKTVLITRAQKQAALLQDLLAKQGARVLSAPAIEIVEKPEQIAELKDALRQLDRYAWLVLTSVNTVTILDSILEHDWRSLQSLQIACIGSATADRVKELGGTVDLIPAKFQAENLAEDLLRLPIAGKRILLPRAEGSRRVLVEELETHGASVHEIQIYRAEIPAGGREELQRLLQQETIDFITFTSSSTAHHFVEMAGDLLPPGIRIASIGPITSATLREYGLTVSVEAVEFTMQGLVDALSNA